MVYDVLGLLQSVTDQLMQGISEIREEQKKYREGFTLYTMTPKIIIMKGIREKNYGGYEGRFSHHGQSYSVSDANYEECCRKLNELKMQVKKKEAKKTNSVFACPSDPLATVPLKRMLELLATREFTFGEAIVFFIERFVRTKRVEPSYVKNLYTYAKHLDMLKDIPIKDMTGLELQEVISAIPLERTRQYARDLARRVLDKFVKLRKIEFNPIDVTEISYVRKRKRDALSIEDQTKLVNYLLDAESHPYHETILFALWTGMRPSEIKRVRKCHFEFDAGYLHVIGTKTDNAPRDVFIPPYFQKLRGASEDYLFRHDFSKINDRLASICIACGIKKYTLYNLRHTFATRLFELGVPDLIIQNLMGHSKIDFTKSQYIKVLSEFRATKYASCLQFYEIGQFLSQDCPKMSPERWDEQDGSKPPKE